MTQKQKVKEKLLADGEVDNFWAFNNRVSLRLGAIIHVLKKEGWVFDEEKSGFIPDTKNWRYVLKSAPKPDLGI